MARPIVILKFGGTSVATREGRDAIARHVADKHAAGRSCVVVVSAMGRRGAPYATDTLLDLIAGLPSDPCERDLLASLGEIISAIVVAHELRAAGIPARAFTGADAGIVTDGHHGNATVVEVRPTAIEVALDDGVTPVVAGFQGVAPEGCLVTLGRGGSDTTACALGVALQAEAVEVFTDVDGVMTADPRTCTAAGVLDVISADELFQLARHGSRVVHTPAAELALASGLTLTVRNTCSDHPGTRVVDLRAYQPRSVVTAISHTTGVVRFRITLPQGEGSQAHMDAQTRIYRAMADAGVSLDMFTPADGALLFTVGSDAAKRAEEVLCDLGLPFTVTGDLAKVTVIGAGMHGVPGVMARVAEHLLAAGIGVLQTADSHTTISVLVPASAAQRAVEALHAGFGLT